MVFMSIDQSLSSSGVIVWEDDTLINWGLIKTQKDETILRIRAIISSLSAIIKQYKVTHVVIESLPYGANSTSVRPLAALYYCIQNMCLDLQVTFSEANVTGVKKFATGSGKADKANMINALFTDNIALYLEIINAKIKKTTGLADLADAYFIGKYYIKEKNDAVK